MSIAELWRRGQQGWPRRFPIVQLPNAPLLLALSGRRLARVGSGRTHDAGLAAFTVGAGVWAWQELVEGSTWLRRVMGAAGIAWLVRDLAQNCGRRSG
jgi:hypothetical protein